MREIIENKAFDQERALYNSNGLLVKNCRFDGPARSRRKAVPVLLRCGYHQPGGDTDVPVRVLMVRAGRWDDNPGWVPAGNRGVRRNLYLVVHFVSGGCRNKKATETV